MPLPLSRSRPVRGLKREEGVDLWVCGGGVLAGTLLPQIDRLALKRHPVVFGSGIPLFGPASYQPRGFALTRTRSFASGVVIEEYLSHARA